MSSPVPLKRSKRSWSVPTAMKVDEIFDSGYSPKSVRIARSIINDTARSDAACVDVDAVQTTKPN